MLLDVRLSKGGVFTQPIPKDFNTFFYVYSGKGVFGSNSVEASEGSFVVLQHDGEEFTMKGSIFFSSSPLSFYKIHLTLFIHF